MQVHLRTLGCRLNEAELETWGRQFQNAGHEVTRDASTAHLIIVNSCAVTQDAARKSRHLIRKIHRENPTAKLVVSGCYASLNTEEAEQLLGVDMVIPNRAKNELVDDVLNNLDLNSMPAMSTEPATISLFNRGRQRAFIKVQDGCRYRCTFCIVTVARGEEKSRTIGEIIDEINAFHQQGVQEVILTGVHLGGYGSDIDTRLSTLITHILQHTDIPRLRLGSLEPWELDDNFFTLFDTPRMMPHLHLPLQSGSDSVLRRMARRCKTAEFRQLVQHIRKHHPHFNLTTDIIVGFPGETDTEWEDSFSFIKEMKFGHIHIFSYSKREGTKAALLPDHVAKLIQKQRSQQLHKCAEQMKQQFFKQNLGQQYPVLWEGHAVQLDNGKKRVFGYTPNYIKVACEIDDSTSVENTIQSVDLVKAQDDFMLAGLT